MSIETTIMKIKYQGNDTSGPWALNFPFTEPQSIKAVRIDSQGLEHDLTYGTDYTVVKNLTGIGGEATATIATGDSVLFYREESLLQGRDFRNYGPNDLEEHEGGLDKLTMITQQLSETMGRAIKTSIGSDVDPDVLVQELFNAAKQVETDKNAVDQAMSNLFSRWNPLITTVDGQADYTLTYPVNTTDKNALVSLEGVLQVPGKDYTFPNPTTIRFTPAPAGGLQLMVVTSISASNPDLQSIVDQAKQDIDDQKIISVNEAIQEIGDEKASSISTVQSAGQQQLNAINSVLPALFDRQGLMNDEANKLISGSALGTEGKWKCVDVFSTNFTNKLSVVIGAGSCIRLYGESGLNIYGSANYMSPSVRIFAVFEDGTILEGQGTWYTALHLSPKYGTDVDIVPSLTPIIIVFQESTEPTDQMAGDLDVVEIFGGGGLPRNLFVQQNVSTACPGWSSGASIVGSNGANGSTPIEYYILENQVGITPEANAEVVVDIENLSGINLTVSFQVTYTDDPTLWVGLSGSRTINSSARVSETFILSGLEAAKTIDSSRVLLENAGTENVAVNIHSITMSNYLSITDFAAILNVGDYVVYNPGYWNGNDWQSQLLGSAPEPSTGVRRLKLNRKAQTPTSYEALNSVGSYADISANCTFNTTGNYVDINVAALWSALGYTSEADLSTNSAVKVKYKTRSNPLNPSVVTESYARKYQVYYTQSAGNSQFVEWLTGNVSTGSMVAFDSSSVTNFREGSVAQLIDRIKFGAFDPAASGHGVLWFAELTETNGKWSIDFSFEEVVDIADHLEMKINNNVVTRELDGNIILSGRKTYKTTIDAKV